MPAPGIARGPALRAGDVVRIRDERWLVVRHTRFDTASIIEVRGADSSNRRARTAFVLPFERLDALPSSTRPRVVSPARWRRAAFEALGSAAPTFEALRTPVGADFTLLPFQLEPALAVTSGLGCRLLIADDVGLGKTIQGALVIAEVFARCRERGHALVVCPAALREQWAAELGTRFGLDTAIVDAPALARLAGAPAAAANPWLSASVAVTSIDFVKRPEVLRSLEPLVWDAIVFDEAHQLSGASDRHAAARVIAERGRTVVLLTATPHSGDDEAFARLCGIGDLGGAFDLSAFRRSRLDADLASRRRTCWLRVAPTPAEREMHRALDEYTRMAWAERGAVHAAVRLAAAVLLRRAASSACSLARSIVRRLELLEMPADMAHQPELPFALDEDDEEPLAVLAAPGLGDPSKERRLLEELRDLADRAADHESKVHALARLLRRAAEPAIVFTEYRDTLAHVAAALGAFAPLQLHGGLTAHERARVLAAFTRGDAQLLLATDAASEGLNLHHRCRLVINLELPWTPLRLEQRAGRVDRLGQPRRVHAVHLVARGTGEETILARLHRRAGRAQAVLDAIRADRGDSEDVVAAIFEATSAAEGRVSRATEL
ncbi:MAG TPA: DEAD/DEAH box helicase, partial [Vicinamibacterales bacterium]|nr:DEAD/DEAH box helicase [Vicinamibacterales bacterium]